MTATVLQLVTRGHAQIRDLRGDPFAKHEVDLTFDHIEAALIPAREHISEALTILRDPSLMNRAAHRDLAAADRLEKALKWLNGQATVRDS